MGGFFSSQITTQQPTTTDTSFWSRMQRSFRLKSSPITNNADIKTWSTATSTPKRTPLPADFRPVDPQPTNSLPAKNFGPENSSKAAASASDLNPRMNDTPKIETESEDVLHTPKASNENAAKLPSEKDLATELSPNKSDAPMIEGKTEDVLNSPKATNEKTEKLDETFKVNPAHTISLKMEPNSASKTEELASPKAPTVEAQKEKKSETQVPPITPQKSVLATLVDDEDEIPLGITNDKIKSIDVPNSLKASNEYTEKPDETFKVNSAHTISLKMEPNSASKTEVPAIPKTPTVEAQKEKKSETQVPPVTPQISVLATLVDDEDEIPLDIKNDRLKVDSKDTSPAPTSQKQMAGQPEVKQETQNVTKSALLMSMQAKKITSGAEKNERKEDRARSLLSEFKSDEEKESDKIQKKDDSFNFPTKKEENIYSNSPAITLSEPVQKTDTHAAKTLMNEITGEQAKFQPVTTNSKPDNLPTTKTIAPASTTLSDVKKDNATIDTSNQSPSDVCKSMMYSIPNTNIGEQGNTVLVEKMQPTVRENVKINISKGENVEIEKNRAIGEKKMEVKTEELGKDQVLNPSEMKDGMYVANTVSINRAEIKSTLAPKNA